MHDFDKLSQQAFAEGSTIEDKNALWLAVFELEEWYCIAQGELPSPYPFATYLEDGKPVLVVFTDSDRTRKYAVQNELNDENEITPMLSLLSSNAIDYFVQFAKNDIWGIWFNPGEIGFYAPLEGLPRIKTHIENLKKG